MDMQKVFIRNNCLKRRLTMLLHEHAYPLRQISTRCIHIINTCVRKQKGYIHLEAGSVYFQVIYNR